MLTQDVMVLATLILLLACLYASVGHGGASGYLAAMALLGVAPEIMKPTALTLNVLVAGLATVRFYQAGYFCWRMLAAFAVGSVPMAFVGGAIRLPVGIYQPLVGVFLLFAAWHLAARQHTSLTDRPVREPGFVISTGCGMGIGLFSGLTGVGGGILLSPLLLLCGWAKLRQAAGVTAAFVLVNSLAGLAGHASRSAHLPGELMVWAPAAVAGGMVGSTLASRHLPDHVLRRLLAVVLLIAGLKMVWPL